LTNPSVIVTGMPGAGKDEFIKVALERGYKEYHMGDVVRYHARKSNIPVSDESIGKFATDERKRYGMHIWAARTVAQMKGKEKVVIDGLRNMEELDYFRKNLRCLYVVAIFASRKDRLERILRRGREDDVKSEEGLIRRDSRELSWGIGEVIALADYTLVNDGTLGDFKQKAGRLLDKLSVKK